MANFDYIILGSGAAGLSLAYAIVNSPLREPSILIIDKVEKQQNDRTWCFWIDRPFPLEQIVYRTWKKLEFVSDTFTTRIELFPYQYKMVRGIDFYQFMREKLSKFPKIKFITAEVQQIHAKSDQASVQIGEELISCQYLFDSRINQGEFPTTSEKCHFLKQHFLGWEITTSKPLFDPDIFTMFDFRTPQQDEMRFFYILPFSSDRALVEYTLFSAQLLPQEEYKTALILYLQNVLGMDTGEYQINAEEKGIIPMTDMPLKRHLGSRWMSIGTKGGMVKPSTGYAFLRIQNDSFSIVNSLLRYGHPFQIPSSPWRYHMFDSTMLQLMYRRGEKMNQYFTTLFQRNPIQRIFRFLDETASIPDNLQLMSTLPAIDFLSASIKSQIFKKI